MKVILFIFAAFVAVNASPITFSEEQLQDLAKQELQEVKNIKSDFKDVREHSQKQVLEELKKNENVQKVMNKLNTELKSLKITVECSVAIDTNFRGLVVKVTEDILSEISKNITGHPDAFGVDVDETIDEIEKKLEEPAELINVCLSDPEKCDLTHLYLEGSEYMFGFLSKLKAVANYSIPKANDFFKSEKVNKLIQNFVSSTSKCLGN